MIWDFETLLVKELFTNVSELFYKMAEIVFLQINSAYVLE